MKRFLLSIALGLYSLAGLAQLIGPNPFTTTGPQITPGGSGTTAFQAALTNSIVPERGGDPTYARATTANVPDHEGIVRAVKSGEARFRGARREENRVVKSEPLSLADTVTHFSQVVAGTGAGYAGVQITIEADSSAPTSFVWKFVNSGASDAWVIFTTTFPALGTTTPYIGSAYFKGDTPARLWLYWQDADSQQTPISSSSWTRVQRNSINTSGGSLAFRLNAGKTQYMTAATLAQAKASTGVVVGEYVSIGKLSAPYHGTGADGVKCFSTLNGNTVDGNGVVTEATGAAISPQPYYYPEIARTYYGLWSDDLTNAAWVKTNITAALNQTGADGRANSASSITATAANGTVLQTLTRASADRITSAYVKRITGSGTIEMTQNNGTTWTPITVTSSWASVYIPNATAANPVFGFRIVTSGDAIAVQYATHVEGEGGVPSPMTTTTATVTRNADSLTYPMPAGLNAAGSAYAEMIAYGGLNGSNLIGGAGGIEMGAGRSLLGYQDPASANSTAIIYDGTLTASVASGSWSAGRKVASRWGLGKMRNFSNNTAATEANFDGSMGAGPISINAYRGSLGVRNVKLWRTIKPDTYLQGLTQ